MTLTATCFPTGYNSSVLEPVTTEQIGVYRYIDPFTMRLCETNRAFDQHDAGTCSPYVLPSVRYVPTVGGGARAATCERLSPNTEYVLGLAPLAGPAKVSWGRS